MLCFLRIKHIRFFWEIECINDILPIELLVIG